MRSLGNHQYYQYLICLGYCLCILSATFIRWMNYFNICTIIILLAYLCSTNKIAKSTICLLWSGFIVIYPLGDALFRGESGLSFFTILCYMVPTLLLLTADCTISNNVKPFIAFFKIFALFQAFGIFLGIVSNGLYNKIVWTLVGWIGNNYKGFSSDATVTAYILCIGTGIFFFESEIYDVEARIELKNKIYAFIIFVALILTSKRSFVLALFFSIVFIELLVSISIPKRFTKVLLISIAASIVFVSVCLSCYKMGISNSLSRIGETILGIQNGEDVTSMRTTWADLMAEWSKDNKLFGIGWESFVSRLEDTEYAGQVPNGHNVYLQVLCETGYVGFGIFMLLEAYTLIYSICLIFKKQREKSKELQCLAMISMFIIIIFIIYCFSGNAIYDSTIYLPFFFAINMLYVIDCAHPIF